VIQDGLKTSYEKAKEYIKNLKIQKRYLRDVY
jgi:sulfite reductase alpha subunit-like flavoprotein